MICFKRSVILLVSVFVFSSPVILARDNPFSWEECFSHALLHNSDIAVSLEEYRGIQIQYDMSKHSTLPEVNASAGVSQTSVIDDSDKNSTGYNIGLQGTQQVYSSTFSEKEYYQQLLYREKAAYQGVLADIRYQVRIAFVDLLYSQYLYDISCKISERRKQNARLVSLQYEGGKEHRGNYLSAKAAYDQASYDVSTAKRSILLKRKKLSQLIGVESGTNFSIDGDLSAPNCDGEPDYEVLVASHYDVIEAEYNYTSLRQKVYIAQLGYMPDVAASGGISQSGGIDQESETSVTLGIEASVSIFDKFQTSDSVKLAKSNLQAAKLELKSVKQKTRLTLEEEWIALLESVENVSLQRNYLSTAEENARIYKSEYELGLISYSNWSTVEDELANSQKSYAAALLASLEAEALWLKDKGVVTAYER